jgi:5-methylcytosine-specific restriction endonuclease McrA
MQEIMFRREVLKLNKLHQPVGFFTPKKVFTALANYILDRRKEYILDHEGKPQRKMLAYDINYHQNEDGTYDFTQMVAPLRLVDWEEWITLPIRSYDLVAHTPKHTIRIPRVVMSLLSDDMPEVTHNTSLRSIYELYDGICQHSNKKIKMSEASRDHRIPISRGGTNTVGNIVLSHKDINSMKGNRLNHECGLPDVIPKIPKKMPIKDVLTNDRDIPEWSWILKKKKK